MFKVVNILFFTFVNMELNSLFFEKLNRNYDAIKSPISEVRYLSEPLINKINYEISNRYKISNEGNSVHSRVVSSFEFGQGPFRVLIWSQMHGNESTTTKAVYDLIYYFLSQNFKTSDCAELLEHLTIKVIPMLNPDGSFEWTRVNANAVDLNRDAKKQSQPETQLLIRIIEEFKPDFCFNMHDQRSIFEAKPSYPATISFLSASYNEQREINSTRLKAMHIINKMDTVLQEFIPNEVGRYDDAFNENCFGDYLHANSLPTVLVEAGHSSGDYAREKTRKLCFLSLIKGLSELINLKTTPDTSHNYSLIPENQKNFTDVLIKNYKISDTQTCDIAIRYKEILSDHSVLIFEPYIDQIGDLSKCSGHKLIKAEKEKVCLDVEKFESQAFVKSIVIHENDFVTKFQI